MSLELRSNCCDAEVDNRSTRHTLWLCRGCGRYLRVEHVHELGEMYLPYVTTELIAIDERPANEEERRLDPEL
jgi:hypothetical protein